MSSAALILHEQLHLTDLLGGVLVVAGLLFGLSRRLVLVRERGRPGYSLS